MIFIPKIIHLSYISIDKIPEMWKDVIPKWKLTHPDWQIKFWSDEDNDNLIKNEFPWFFSTYNSFKYKIQKCDAVRACYLYKFGGIYVDMDYLPKKNLNSLFENVNCNLFFTQSSNIDCFTNSFMASKPNQEFWIQYLESMIDQKLKWYYTKHLVIYYTTGPFKLNSLIKQHNDIIGYIPAHIINACTICNKHCTFNKNKNVYLQSIDGQTWNSIDTHFYNFIYCKYKLIIILILILFLSFIYRVRKCI